MISYRKLAMRVLGHPLRVSTNTPRPASHRVTALALTAAMVAGMAAPAYAGTYYIDNNGGDITVTKDTDGIVYVKRSKKDYEPGSLGDQDEDGNVIIKGGNGTDIRKNPDPVRGSSEGTTTTNSAAKSASATPQSEDDSDPKEMVYLGDTKGSDSSEGGSEGNETDSTEKNQTDTSGSEGDTTGNEENDPKPGGTPTTGSGTPAESTESSSPVLESQFTYTSAYNDEGTPTESTTTLKTAADNFKAAAQNVIRIINKATGDDNTLNVTLEDVNIDARDETNPANGKAALSIEGAGDTKITLKGDNNLTSGGSHAGLEHNEESTVDNGDSVDTGKLTITSKTDKNGNNTGNLTATGGSGAAGIGSSNGKGAGTIEITGGDIKATGGTGGAGIGGGKNSSGATNINITGGEVHASTYYGNGGAGIGGGEGSTGATTIDISGNAQVSANGSDGAGIGGGKNSSGATNINISENAQVSANGSNGAGIGSGSYSTNATDININGGKIEASSYYGSGIGSGNSAKGNTDIRITGSNVTAIASRGAGIGSGPSSSGKTTIDISGGTVTATGGGDGYDGSAGIGAGMSSTGDTHITLHGGVTVEAKGGGDSSRGGSGGAGIGSGSAAKGHTTILIEGAKEVTATGGSTAAGIGSGHYVGHSETGPVGSTTITIRNSGNVIPIITATGGSDENGSCWASGAGIGSGGNTLNKTTINIEGGEITATGGVSLDSRNPSDKRLSGAGIGSGSNVSGETEINISSGTIKSAFGGKYGGAGIGSGSYSDTAADNEKGAVTINITGGTIEKAEGGGDYVSSSERWYSGAGIGAGLKAGTTTINIKDNARIASAKGGEYGGAGIGGGYGSGTSIINILKGIIGTVTGGQYGAGIGSGRNNESKVHISGGTLQTVTGGACGAGIGGGFDGSSSDVTITGGTLQTVTGGLYGAGIGSGYYDGSSTVNISGDAKLEDVKGGEYAAGIGGGGVSKNVEVVIDGGTIKATGTSDAPAIGGGSVSISNADAPLDITATAPVANKAIQSSDGKTLDAVIQLAENGKKGLVKLVESGTTSISRLFHNGVYTASLPGFSGGETHPLGEWHTKAPTCTEPGKKWRSCTVDNCVVTETEKLPALGHQWSGWTPVEGGSREYRICTVCNAEEYRDVSHNSGISDSSNSGDSTISTGLRILDPAQADILQNVQLVRLNQINDVLYIDVSHETASLQGVLSDLTGLRSENIETIVFSTERCTSTLSLSDVAALGAGDTPFTLSHSGSTATFTVDGADHSALLR